MKGQWGQYTNCERKLGKCVNFLIICESVDGHAINENFALSDIWHSYDSLCLWNVKRVREAFDVFRRADIVLFTNAGDQRH